MNFRNSYIGSNIAILLGIILLFIIGTDAGPTPGFFPGIQLILGTLAYKAAKKQKFQSSSVWLMVEICAITLFVTNSFLYVIKSFECFTCLNLILEYRIPQILFLLIIPWVFTSYVLVRFSKKNA